MSPPPSPSRASTAARPRVASPIHSKPPLAPKPPGSPVRSPVPRSPIYEPPRSPVYCDDGSSNDSTTPSDLHVAVPLTRKSSDLSDLSGSAHSRSSLGSIPRNISTDGGVASSKEPWKQPHVLSRQAPKDAGVVIVEQKGGDGVEIVKSKKPILHSTADSRIPLVVLLMNPSRKWYELQLLWVDASTDTVRDVFLAMKQKISDKWKRDYDGFLQFRAGKCNQLINCLALNTYDLAPYEVWVAKPSHQAAKVTESCADDLLKHLKNVGMISQGVGGILTNASGNIPPRRKSKGATAPSIDGILTLSLVARSRIYAPEGILKHHHAGLFLTFSPPFEPEIELQDQDSDDGSLEGLSIDIGKHNEKMVQDGLSPIGPMPELSDNDVKSIGSSNKLFVNKRPPKAPLGRNGNDTRKSSDRPRREGGLVRLKLLGNCFGRADCVNNRESSGYEWNRPGSSSDFVPMRSLETGTTMTESPSLPRQVTDSWSEIDDYSMVSNQDSFAPLINRRGHDASFAIRRNKVTDSVVEI